MVPKNTIRINMTIKQNFNAKAYNEFLHSIKMHDDYGVSNIYMDLGNFSITISPQLEVECIFLNSEKFNFEIIEDFASWFYLGTRDTHYLFSERLGESSWSAPYQTNDIQRYNLERKSKKKHYSVFRNVFKTIFTPILKSA